MRILIISDSHGNNSAYSVILKKEKDLDMIIHCGDISGSEYYYSQTAPCPLVMVNGNNDYSSDIPMNAQFELGKYSVWVTHGHKNHVNFGRDWLMEEAQNRGADIVLYGHTHVPRIEYDDERRIYAVNPGSLTYPRQEGHNPSYIIMEIDDKNEVNFSLKFL